jgi:hypothetical protein
MSTAKCPAVSNTGRLTLCRPKAHRTRGGSSDSEVQEFTVRPTGTPSFECVVMTVTPVGKQPKARRNIRGSGGEWGWAVSRLLKFARKNS